MKKIFIALSLLVFISSCTETDLCKGVTCQNGGVCESGDCNCPLGYEGTNCETEVRAKYVGAFNGTEACNPSGTTTVAITNANVTTDVTKVTFSNLYGANFITNGTVQADGTILIANQAFGTGQISGSASINNGKIVITYTVVGTGASDACTWTQL